MDRQRPVVLLVAGLATFLLTLVVRIPASVVIGLLFPDGMATSGIVGTLWSGAAATVSAGGLRLEDTRWRVSPFSLLLGRLVGDVETRLGDASAAGRLGLGLSGTLSCTDCRYRGTIAALRPLVPALRAVDGNLELQLDTLELRGGWPTRLAGVARLSEVPLDAASPADNPAARGAFSGKTEHDPVGDDGRIEVLVEDAGGPIEIKATIVVTPPGTFALTGQARSRPGAPESIANALKVLGPRTSNGSTELTFSGNF
ncbi:MAG: type II secretion system protein N [Gammaproteobacteria bacterium]|nr:type II secretion system protein N [Gammaproteobacteria bacterium]